MKEIVDITVTQVRLYSVDSVPIVELRLSASMNAVKEAFHFGNIQIDPIGGTVNFTNGVFEERGKALQVLSLSLEDRRIVIQAKGRSSLADAFYLALINLLNELGKRGKRRVTEPLLKAEETTCIATLDIDFEELIAPAFHHFIQNTGKTMLRTNYGTPKSVTFKNLSFEIRYAPVNPHLEEHDIALGNKLLTIEPRVATPLRERKFFTSSPTSSETHIEMLGLLEKEIAKDRHRR